MSIYFTKKAYVLRDLQNGNRSSIGTGAVHMFPIGYHQEFRPARCRPIGRDGTDLIRSQSLRNSTGSVLVVFFSANNYYSTLLPVSGKARRIWKDMVRPSLVTRVSVEDRRVSHNFLRVGSGVSGKNRPAFNSAAALSGNRIA